MGPITYISGKLNQDLRLNINQDLIIQGYIDPEIIKKLTTAEELKSTDGRIVK